MDETCRNNHFVTGRSPLSRLILTSMCNEDCPADRGVIRLIYRVRAFLYYDYNWDQVVRYKYQCYHFPMYIYLPAYLTNDRV
jgi:hypothetical protein